MFLVSNLILADSLWNERANSLYSSKKANNTGDLITIYISVSSSAVQEAGTKTSKESNAEKKISQAEGHVASLAEKIENKEVPKELLSSYIYKLEGIKQDITKRKDATPDADLKKKADKIVENSVKMLEQLTTAISKQDEEITEDAIYVDTPKKLKMNKEGQVVYETIVGILREYYYNESEVFEEILTKIRVALEDVME